MESSFGIRHSPNLRAIRGLKLARLPLSLAATLAALPSVSLVPVAPFSEPDLTIQRFNVLTVAKPFVFIRVHSWLNGTSLTASYEGQITEVWEKASIQKREQRIAREWDCKIHRTRHGKRE